MSKFKTLLDKIIALPDQKVSMQELASVLNEHMMKLEIVHPDVYWGVIHEMHEIVYDSHFDEDMAMYAVSKMENEDGSTGAHWNKAETDQVGANEGLAFDKFNKWDWYYVLNMIHSDYYKAIGGNTSMYFQLAKAWITDKDAPEGKAFRYWSAMCE